MTILHLSILFFVDNLVLLLTFRQMSQIRVTWKQSTLFVFL